MSGFLIQCAILVYFNCSHMFRPNGTHQYSLKFLKYHQDLANFLYFTFTTSSYHQETNVFWEMILITSEIVEYANMDEVTDVSMFPCHFYFIML